MAAIQKPWRRSRMIFECGLRAAVISGIHMGPVQSVRLRCLPPGLHCPRHSFHPIRPPPSFNPPLPVLSFFLSLRCSLRIMHYSALLLLALGPLLVHAQDGSITGPTTSQDAAGYSCDASKCKLPNCACASTSPPGGLDPVCSE